METSTELDPLFIYPYSSSRPSVNFYNEVGQLNLDAKIKELDFLDSATTEETLSFHAPSLEPNHDGDSLNEADQTSFDSVNFEEDANVRANLFWRRSILHYQC